MNIYYSITVARASLPRLTLAQRVVDKMVANAKVYDTETGESLVGFAIKSMGRTEPDLYVLDTIAPDDSAIRRGAYFEQGDDLQGDIFAWLFDNWELYRARRRNSYGNALAAKWDAPLIHLGDWHKHPGTLIEPSWGDTDTAREHIHDTETAPQILAILATVWDKQRADAFDAERAANPNNGDPQPIKVPIDDHTLVRLDCWYMSRHTRRFVRLSPTVSPDDTLPVLPIIGWHLNQQDRMRRELMALSDAGYAVSIEPFDADKLPPREICLSVATLSSQRVLIVVTQADYPNHRPGVRTVPMSVMKSVKENENLFLILWNASQPIAEDAYPDWKWTPDHTILELVRAVEAKLPEGSAVS